MDRSSDAANSLSTTFAEWFATPLGAYLGQREQAYFDRTVADIFGFHALQIGLPECPFLAQSRIVSNWTLDYDPPADIIADPHGLPFAENTIDLIVMPHALEFTDDPHLMLREAWRVIRPEGQIVISGFNPFSLFGTKRYFGRGATPPWNGNFIALYRLKDWLSLLGFDVIGGQFDCYVPPFTQDKWLRRFVFFEKTGDRWWPITGGVYYPARDEEGARHAPAHAGVGASRAPEKGAGAGRGCARGREPDDPSQPPVSAASVGDHAGAVVIYTDGACKGNPGPGGWGALLIFDGREKELFGGEPHTTNNRMELTAVIRALEALKRACDVELYLDSQYVKHGIEKLDPQRGRRTAGARAIASRSRTRTCGASSTRSPRRTGFAGIGCAATPTRRATIARTSSRIAASDG